MRRLPLAFFVLATALACGGGDVPSEPLVPPADDPSPPAPGADPRPLGIAPNLPQGANLTLRHERAFAASPEGGLTDYFEYQLAAGPGAPFSGPSVYRQVFPPNDLGNGIGGTIMEGPGDQALRRIFVGFWIFIPGNYSVHSNGEKLVYPIRSSGASGEAASFMLQIQPAEGQTNGRHWRLMLEPQGSDPGFNNQRRAGNTANDERITKGAWHLIEGYFVHNTPGREDGVARWWVDGRLVGDYRDVGYSPADGSRGVWTRFRMTSTRGGGASSAPTPASGQFREFDHLVVYAAER